MNTYEYIVNKYKIAVGRRYIVDIDDMDRDEMAELFKELGYKKGAEIGVERAYYSEILCQKNPELLLYAIDPWSPGAYEPGIHGVDYDQAKYDERYKEAAQRMASYKCTIIRKTSLEAVKDFEDESLDFVYIDANHDFVNFINDLHYWTKKVRIGGIVSGHDYAEYAFHKHNHVKRALEAYARSYAMVPLFIVGGLAMEDGKKRDKFRSWFWVKDK